MYYLDSSSNKSVLMAVYDVVTAEIEVERDYIWVWAILACKRNEVA